MRDDQRCPSLSESLTVLHQHQFPRSSPTPQQRRPLPILPTILLLPLHAPKLSPINLPHNPSPLLTRTIKELLIFLETPPSTFRRVSPSPPARKRISARKHQKQPVLWVVESDRRQQCDREIRDSPDY